jgi:hypothetical protein
MNFGLGHQIDDNGTFSVLLAILFKKLFCFWSQAAKAPFRRTKAIAL